MKKKRISIIIAVCLLLIIGIAILFSFLPQKQQPQNEARGKTTLSFLPESSDSSPLQKNPGDKVELDLIVNPGTDAITFVKFQIKYDPAKIEIDAANPFTVETTTFSGFSEGPVLTNGLLSQSVSIGFDPTKTITQPTKIGTLHGKIRKDAKNTSTTISFTNLTQILSAGGDAAATQNVLSQTKPAIIVVK